MNVRFTIIIAAYNAERYIETCVNSILNQNYNNYEIIIADDGSKDRTFEIVNNNYSKLENITIITKEHTGVSDTRNIAMKYVNGDWISFLDSDDWLEENCLYELNNIINEYEDLQIILSDLIVNKQNREYKLYPSLNRHIIYEKRDLIETTISIKYGEKKYGIQYGNCRCIGGKFYDYNLIKDNEICFNEELITFEDGIFNLWAYLKAKKILLVENAWYHYRQVETSTTHNKNIDQKKQNNGIVKNIEKFNNYNPFELDEAINYCIFELLISSFDKAVKNKNINLIKDEVKVRKKYIKKISTFGNYLDKKEKLFLFIFKYNMTVFLYKYSFYKRLLKGE